MIHTSLVTYDGPRRRTGRHKCLIGITVKVKRGELELMDCDMSPTTRWCILTSTSTSIEWLEIQTEGTPFRWNILCPSPRKKALYEPLVNKKIRSVSADSMRA